MHGGLFLSTIITAVSDGDCVSEFFFFSLTKKLGLNSQAMNPFANRPPPPPHFFFFLREADKTWPRLISKVLW